MLQMLSNAELVLAFIGGIGPTELILIFAIVLLLFGGAKLPELARSMGKAMRSFKEESNQLKREIEAEVHRDDKKSSASEVQSKTSAASSSPSQSKP